MVVVAAIIATYFVAYVEIMGPCCDPDSKLHGIWGYPTFCHCLGSGTRAMESQTLSCSDIAFSVVAGAGCVSKDFRRDP